MHTKKTKRKTPHKIALTAVLRSALCSHFWRSIATLAVIILSVVLEVVPPLVLARAVDMLTANKAVSLALGLTYFLLLAGSGLSEAVREALIVATGESMTHAIRTAMMDKLTRLPADYFTRHESGKISAVQVNDVDAIEDMFSSGLVSMITDLGTVVAILAVVFTKSVGLGVLLVVVLPLLIAFTRAIQKRMLSSHTENRRATAQASGMLPETLHIIQSLHVYHAEDFAEKRYDAAIQDSFRAIEKTNFYDAVYSPVIMTVSAAVIGVMMALSGQSGAFRGWFGISVGTAVAMIAYVNQIFTPLSSIGMEIQTIQAAAAGWQRVQTFLDETEMSVNLTEGVSQPDPAIVVRDVNFSYDKSHDVLEHFSLMVDKGEFVTLMGRTGAGKSTLFKLLLGLYAPDQGEIRIDGMPPQAVDTADRRHIICCVEQKVTPVPGTIRDQVTLGNPAFNDAAVWRALDIAGLKATVQDMPDGLKTPYADASFSQGQKQLLMIARAVVSDPRVLLLDEITAGLDSATEKMIVAALKKASENRTVLSISHRLSGVMGGRVVTLQ